jgi:hypothetical protein
VIKTQPQPSMSFPFHRVCRRTWRAVPKAP